MPSDEGRYKFNWKEIKEKYSTTEVLAINKYLRGSVYWKSFTSEDKGKENKAFVNNYELGTGFATKEEAKKEVEKEITTVLNKTYRQAEKDLKERLLKLKTEDRLYDIYKNIDNEDFFFKFITQIRKEMFEDN